ncbi:MAG: RICIN domain-containing protein [Jatrophihabitantaceae bacterium]
MVRKPLAAVLLGIALMLVTLLSPTAAQAGPNGQYYPYVNSTTHTCITGIGQYNHQLTASNCTGSGGQLWSLSTNTRSCCGYVYHQIINLNSGMCIGVRYGSTSSGAAVVEGGCYEANDQYWAIIYTGQYSNGEALFIMANWGSGKCIRPVGGGGVSLEQNNCDKTGRLWGNSYAV